MKLSKLLGAVAIGVMAYGGAAQAVPITFTHIGVGSGTVDGSSFTDAAFTISDTTDTTLQIDAGGGFFFINDLTASITISGLGTFTFLTPTKTSVFNDAANSVVGFGLAGADGADLFTGPFSSAFSGYQLLTSIGPITNNTGFADGFASALTSGGILQFASNPDATTGPATFQAAVVPEPSTYLLVAAGLIGIALRRRKK